jgi:hypothetical protein
MGMENPCLFFVSQFVKEKEQYFSGSVIDIKDEGEQSAETYKNSLSQELAKAIQWEGEKSDGTKFHEKTSSGCTGEVFTFLLRNGNG